MDMRTKKSKSRKIKSLRFNRSHGRCSWLIIVYLGLPRTLHKRRYANLLPSQTHPITLNEDGSNELYTNDNLIEAVGQHMDRAAVRARHTNSSNPRTSVN